MSDFEEGKFCNSIGIQNQGESPKPLASESLDTFVSKHSRHKLELEGWEKNRFTVKYFTPEQIAQHAHELHWINREINFSIQSIQDLQQEGYEVVLVPDEPEKAAENGYNADVYIREKESEVQPMGEHVLAPKAREAFLNRYLPERDKELIKTGLVRLRELLDSYSDDKIPQLILLPETAVRPLVYAIKPVIDDWYFTKGKNPPRFVFVKTDALGHTIEVEQRAEEKHGTHYREKYLKDEIPAIRQMYAENNLGQKIDDSRAQLEARILEIQQKCGFKDTPSALVIDDYARYNRSTYKEMRRAYQRVAHTKDAPIKGFAFLTGISPSIWDDEDRDKAAAADTAIGFHYGSVDPNTMESGPMGPIYDTDGFAFRTMGFLNMHEPKKQLMTGVKKTLGPHVRRSDEQSIAVMTLLRQEMKKIGQLIASEREASS